MPRRYVPLTPKKPPQKPSLEEKPNLAEYGLSEEGKNWLTKNRKRFQNILGWTIIILVNVLILYNMFSGQGKIGVKFSLLGLYLMLGLPICSAASYGIGWLIIKILFNNIFPEAKKLDKYNEELKKYESALRAYNAWLNKTCAAFWYSLNGRGFEVEMAELFRRMGYVANLTAPGGGDGGVDILLENDNERIIVQCKAHRKPVGPSVARDLFGTMHHYEANSAILACTGGFTKGVFEYVNGKPIKLLSIDEILEIQDRIVTDKTPK